MNINDLMNQVKNDINRLNKSSYDNQMKIKFNETFPDINFDDLQKQTNRITTNDGSTHYKHKYNGNIYSYGFDKWTLNKYGDKLDKTLFT